MKRLMKKAAQENHNELMLTLMDIMNKLDEKDVDDAIDECSNLGYNSEMKRLFLIKEKLHSLKDSVNNVMYDIRNKMNRPSYAALSFEAVKNLMLKYDEDEYYYFLEEYNINLFDSIRELARFVVENDGKHYYNVELLLNQLDFKNEEHPCVVFDMDIYDLHEFDTYDDAKIFALESLMHQNQEGYLKLVNILKNKE